ncbi:MAG: GGDEF domain-containing protein [Aquificae bacterium]|nr:GGDEF domain-containing protein [Aquificota bacterium]
MSLRNKLILSTFLVSFSLSLITILIFGFIAYHNMQDNVQEVYDSVARTFSFAQRTLAQGADDVVIKLQKCQPRRSGTYILLREEGLLIGRVENCVFYGTSFYKVVNFTANVNNLDWFILYDRVVLERLSEENPEFFDRFIKDRFVIDDFVVEGNFNPKVIREVKNSTGYKLTEGFKTLIMDFPVVIRNEIPVGRVVFLRDFSPILREALFTPLIFLGYTLTLVVVLSLILFVLFNRIVKEVSLLRRITNKFKDLDFSDVPKLNEMLKRERARDELFYLKRAILAMAQELEDTINKLQVEKNRFEEMAYTDPLTGLSNRRFFMEEAKRMMDLAKRYKEPLALIMLDIDNFKRINDQYGHDVGDLVLKSLADVIKRSVRSSDIPARFGGEEFVIMLPRTDERGAVMVAERIREGFRNSKVHVNGKDVWTTVSVGIALYEPGEDIESLIKKADEALYEAKRKGKDRVEVFKLTEEHPEKD